MGLCGNLAASAKFPHSPILHIIILLSLCMQVIANGKQRQASGQRVYSASLQTVAVWNKVIYFKEFYIMHVPSKFIFTCT